jgi:hypothetical protein
MSDAGVTCITLRGVFPAPSARHPVRAPSPRRQRKLGSIDPPYNSRTQIFRKNIGFR